MPVRSDIIRNNNISIRLLADGFSFAYLKGEELKESLYLVDPELSLSENLRTAIKSLQDLPVQDKGDIFLIIATERYTTLPLALFSQEDKEALFQASMKKEEDETVFHQICKALGQVFLFIAPSFLTDVIQELLPEREIHLVCQAALIASSLEEASQEPQIVVHIERDLLTIQCVRKGSLTYSKAFQARSNEDRLFYILSAVKGLGLDQTTLEMKLLIATREALPLASEMQVYIERISTTGPEQTSLLDHRISRQCV